MSAALVLAAAVSVCLMLPRDKAVQGSDRLAVVTTTSLLKCAVEEIGGERVAVESLIAPGSCPGHFDMSPRQITALFSSRLVMTHGYEHFVHNLAMHSSAGGRKPELVKVPVEGNWLVPDLYILGAREVARTLRSADPSHAREYQCALVALEGEVRRLAEDLRRQLEAANARKTKVLCADQQRPVVEWMGFQVAGTYTRAEEFTPGEVHRLTRLGRAERVALVVDNLQSGPDAGMQLARDIGAAHVTFSNFPGGFERTGAWGECLSENVRRALRALGENSPGR